MTRYRSFTPSTGAFILKPEENEKSEPCSNRTQVRIFLVWWAREQNIPCDLKDPAWFDKIDASGGAVFFASGVFYYFLTQQVKALVQGMADAFPGGVLVFDAANRTAVKMIAKTWLRTAKIKDVGSYFAVSDAPKEIGEWDSRLQVSSKG